MFMEKENGIKQRQKKKEILKHRRIQDKTNSNNNKQQPGASKNKKNCLFWVFKNCTKQKKGNSITSQRHEIEYNEK